jgi:uncharacterized protein YndB with AHSA1/START domain
MDATRSPATAITLPSDRELVITRTFDAPRRLVFEAITRPEHVRRWYGLRRLTLTVCEIDLRPGGAWRYVMRDLASGAEFGFSGVYREITPPERLVSTERFEALPDHDYVVTVTLDERDGQTTLRSHCVYQSAADRDGHFHSGMEAGVRETYDRLAELLAHLQTTEAVQ